MKSGSFSGLPEKEKSLQAGLLLRAMKEKCELFQHHNPCPEGKFSDKAVGFRCRLVPVWVRFNIGTIVYGTIRFAKVCKKMKY